MPVMTAVSPVPGAAAAGPAPRRILFSVRNFWFLKYYGSVLRSLAARGHRLHLIADRADIDLQFADWMVAVEALAAEFPNVTYGWLPPRRKDRWNELRRWAGRLSDYVRFLEPQFVDTPVLRRRAANHVGARMRSVLEHRWSGRTAMVRVLQGWLNTLDRAISPVDHLETILRDYQPDLLMVSPLVTLGSRQSDIVRAARNVGVPSAFAAGSWDHLSSKARIREVPDAMLVWNDTQRREAADYHGVSSDRVVVTGAQCFDEWFERSPSRDREAFCRAVGLPSDRPLIFYVCSSLFWGSPLEAAFVERWVAAVRASSHPSLREAAILIRPHPKRGEEWRDTAVTRFDNVVVYPPLGQSPLGSRAKDDYFDSLSYADAIVGLNTSAQIEGALVGKPVYTVLLPEFWDNQEGTLHFHYLLESTGGPLRAARDLDEHLQQVAEGLADPAAAAARNRAFVAAFVRPNGLDRSATAVFVEAIERIAAAPRRPVRAALATATGLLARLVMLPFAFAMLWTPAGDGRAREAVKRLRSKALEEGKGKTIKAPRREPKPVRKRERFASTAAAVRGAQRPASARNGERGGRTGAGAEAAPVYVEVPPQWAWALRAVVYPLVKRINVGRLSDERLWRAARYKQKERQRQRERAQALAARAARSAPAAGKVKRVAPAPSRGVMDDLEHTFARTRHAARAGIGRLARRVAILVKARN